MDNLSRMRLLFDLSVLINRTKDKEIVINGEEYDLVAGKAITARWNPETRQLTYTLEDEDDDESVATKDTEATTH